MSESRHNRRVPALPLIRFAIPLLLALFWVQLSIAAHQFDHVAGQYGDYCELCLQLERNDDGVLPAVSIRPAETPLPATPVAETTTTARAPGISYQSRAPPAAHSA